MRLRALVSLWRPHGRAPHTGGSNRPAAPCVRGCNPACARDPSPMRTSGARLATDGDPNTYWVSIGAPDAVLTLDLGTERRVTSPAALQPCSPASPCIRGCDRVCIQDRGQPHLRLDGAGAHTARSVLPQPSERWVERGWRGAKRARRADEPQPHRRWGQRSRGGTRALPAAVPCRPVRLCGPLPQWYSPDDPNAIAAATAAAAAARSAAAAIPPIPEPAHACAARARRELMRAFRGCRGRSMFDNALPGAPQLAALASRGRLRATRLHTLEAEPRAAKSAARRRRMNSCLGQSSPI